MGFFQDSRCLECNWSATDDDSRLWWLIKYQHIFLQGPYHACHGRPPMPRAMAKARLDVVLAQRGAMVMGYAKFFGVKLGQPLNIPATVFRDILCIPVLCVKPLNHVKPTSLVDRTWSKHLKQSLLWEIVGPKNQCLIDFFGRIGRIGTSEGFFEGGSILKESERGLAQSQFGDRKFSFFYETYTIHFFSLYV